MKRTAWLQLTLALGICAGAAALRADEVVRGILGADEAVTSGRGGSYDPQDRRDPFVDPTTALPRGHGPRPEGPRGALLAEVKLFGIGSDEAGPLVLVTTSDGMGHPLREGDELWDARVVAIRFATAEVTFQQRVDEPQGGPRYRTVTRRFGN